MTIAFGREKNKEEIEAIIKKNFSNIGQGMMEMLYFLSHPELVPARITYEGEQHLKKALSDGRGVIAVTAHFGNFPLMMLALAQRGYPAHCVIRPARDEELEKYLLRRRTEVGLKTIYAIPRKECVDATLKALRSNELVFIPLDQHFGSGGGVYVDFFGQKAATATGPVVFARRAKAAILPMFIIRQKDDHHKVIIEPPVALAEHEQEDEALRLSVEKITRLIEQYIRKYPYEWGWMHRRWKNQPAQKENKEESLI